MRAPESNQGCRLASQERLLLAVLLLAYPKPITLEKMIDLAYGADPEGGPLSADNCITVRMVAVRKLLRMAGIDVANAGGKYQIVFPGDEKVVHFGPRERQIYDLIKTCPGIGSDRLMALSKLPHNKLLGTHIFKLRHKLSEMSAERLVSERDPKDGQRCCYRIVAATEAAALAERGRLRRRRNGAA